ncbi:WD40-repeat-containing domain protein [Syncephalastrum racemosum]|uniref:WD40-repeat-containing domain protein n=1 Tax=Syncephalastrum racemosum TaxID=13706 RepID=A0A1X2H0T6_SYNRA|nr:WD40-repeat-containing domain protein [Syncephalastrum racemosum]
MPTTYIPTLVVEKAHEDDIWCVAWTRRDNLIVTGSADGSVKIWYAADGSIPSGLGGHAGVISVDFSMDGTRLVSASLDSVLHIWNLENKASLERTIQADAVQSWTAKFSPDGKYVSTGSYNGQIHTYDLATGERISSIQTGADFILCLAYSGDGKYLAAGTKSGVIHVYNVETDQLAHALSGHAQPVRALAFAPDNITLISGSDDHCINVYDVEHGSLASVLEGHDGWILSVAANPDISKQQFASVSSDKKVKVWDLAMRSVIETHEIHEDAIYSVAWNPEGTKLVSVSGDQSIKWFASSGS